MPSPAVDRESGARAPLPEPQPPRSIQPRRPPGPLLLLCFLLPPLSISSSLTHLPLSQVRHEQPHGWAPPADAKSPLWPPFVLVDALRIPAESASSASPSCRSPSTSTTCRHGLAPPPEMPRPPPEPAKNELQQEHAAAARIFSSSLLVGSSRPCFPSSLTAPPVPSNAIARASWCPPAMAASSLLQRRTSNACAVACVAQILRPPSFAAAPEFAPPLLCFFRTRKRTNALPERPR
ncbi:uncharacterized protein LOC119359369 [Triticum dicoccoides]|uniref:uncharacterized protein LOC119359369 n=1 Tax=Triticum dicoccoides TaxID=85692 RepID=UPI00188F2DDA|nr:uncharacterized protein LOC119359369 [Triticum dicoccoides]